MALPVPAPVSGDRRPPTRYELTERGRRALSLAIVEDRSPVAVLTAADFSLPLLGVLRYRWALSHVVLATRSDAGAYALWFRFTPHGAVYRADAPTLPAVIDAAQAGRARLVRREG